MLPVEQNDERALHFPFVFFFVFFTKRLQLICEAIVCLYSASGQEGRTAERETSVADLHLHARCKAAAQVVNEIIGAGQGVDRRTTLCSRIQL